MNKYIRNRSCGFHKRYEKMTSEASSYHLSGFINAAAIKPLLFKSLHYFTRCVCGLMLCAFSILFPTLSHADDFDNLAKRCAPTVAVDTLRALVKTESDFNPYAIGVVGGKSFMPKSFHEAMAKIAELEAEGKNYSVGLAQINKSNFAKLNLNAMQALDACTNLKAAAVILGDCYERASRHGADEKQSLNDALSCYYSGNFKTGYEHGYVTKVRKHAQSVPSVNGTRFSLSSLISDSVKENENSSKLIF